MTKELQTALRNALERNNRDSPADRRFEQAVLDKAMAHATAAALEGDEHAQTHAAIAIIAGVLQEHVTEMARRTDASLLRTRREAARVAALDAAIAQAEGMADTGILH